MSGPSICVGMSTYDDFDGVWFTIQSICVHHPEVRRDLSFVVIDNHPEGRAAKPLKALEGWIANYRYVPFSGYRGTAVRIWCSTKLTPRSSAASTHTCCFSLARWLRFKHGSPIVPPAATSCRDRSCRDDLRNGATHMEPTWRDGMYGIWGMNSRLADTGAIRDHDARTRSLCLSAGRMAGAQPTVSRLRRRGGLPAREGSPERGPRALPPVSHLGPSFRSPCRRGLRQQLAGPRPQLHPRLVGAGVGTGARSKRTFGNSWGRRRTRSGSGRASRSSIPWASSMESSVSPTGLRPATLTGIQSRWPGGSSGHPQVRSPIGNCGG